MKIMLILNRKSFEYDKFSILLGNDKEKWFVRPHSCVCRTIYHVKSGNRIGNTEDGTIEESPAHFLNPLFLSLNTLCNQHTPHHHHGALMCAQVAHINPFSMDEWDVICMIMRAISFTNLCFRLFSFFAFCLYTLMLYSTCNSSTRRRFYTTFLVDYYFRRRFGKCAKKTQKQINKKTNERRRQESSLKQITD